MDSPPTQPGSLSVSRFAVHGTRTSTVIVHHVPEGFADQFVEWQRGISKAAAAFPGYQTTDVYPPMDATHEQWVVVIHFSDAATLQRWFDSKEREEWRARLPAEIAQFRLKTLTTGFGPWFAGLVDDDGRLPPHWKMALSVLLPLYPTVMLLSIFLSPYTMPFGLAFSVLIGNAGSIVLLEWVVMPVLRKVLKPWLTATADRIALSAFGLVIILGVLATLALLFRHVTG